MAEMSTLLGYEIVDKKAREMIAGLEGGGTSVEKYETQLDRVYKHFNYDRSVRPYCVIAIPKSSSYISGGFYLFFYDNKLAEKDASWGKQVFCSYGIYNATLTSLPDDFNNIEKVVDFVTDNFSSSDVKYSGSWHTIDTVRYYYYANYKTSSFPTIELDIPFDGDIKFPKISDMDITHGSKGQLLITEGNGAISFVSLPPVASYEDRLYEHFKISKLEYPYVYVTITFTGNSDKYVIFTDGIELTDRTADEPPKYTITGRHKFAVIPVLAGLSNEVCRDLESVTNYIINNMAPIDLNGVYNPGTSILRECFATDGYHYVTINKPAGTYNNVFDLRQLPLLTVDRGARFKSTTKNGRVTGDYGEAGQYMITNGDGTISFADGAGSGTDITVPTKVSELENDVGYITADDLTALNTEAVYSTESKTVVVTPFTDTVIDSLTLPAGTYYIQGKFEYDGSDLRYLHRLKANGKGIANVSMYDNAGVVVGNVSGICNFESETVVEYEVYLNKNDVTECTLNYVRMDAVRAGVTVVNAPLDIAEGGAY